MQDKLDTDQVLDRIIVKGVTNSVMEQLEERIISGALPKGQKLPSEQELSEQAGVGRRAVREALKTLEAKGLVEIRKGSGAWVTRNDFDSFIESMTRNVQAYLELDSIKLRHLLQFRELLAGSVIAILAQAPKQETTEALQRSLEAQKEAYRNNSWTGYAQAHLEFHRTIIESLGNPIVTTMYSQVIRLLEPAMKKAGSVRTIVRSSVREHQEILDAIRRGDAGRAHQAVQSHLAFSMKHLNAVLGH